MIPNGLENHIWKKVDPPPPNPFLNEEKNYKESKYIQNTDQQDISPSYGACTNTKS